MATLLDDYQAPAANQVDDYTKQKLQLLVKRPQEFLTELSPLQPLQLKEVQENLWDIIMAESGKKGVSVTRSDIISRFEPTTNYQYRAGCKEPLGYCTLNMCIRLDPKCSVNRLRGMIEVLRKILAEMYKAEDLDSRLAELETTHKPYRAIPAASSETVVEHPDVALKISQIKSKLPNLREILFSIIEIDGAEMVAMIDKRGKIVELVSNNKIQSTIFTRRIAMLTDYFTRLGDRVFSSGIQSSVNEYENGLILVHKLDHDLFILISSSTRQVPASFAQKTYRIAGELNAQLASVFH
ncbi:MAG: hypothetical protein HUU10_15520 [Bacteroidetes bacterium]|nr:hypothetical protein [Bacteroidota bacterium]